jgi:hypothetical protein
MSPQHHEVGVGATAELSLRASVATLVRVLFKHPENDELMLALERKAMLCETDSGSKVDVKCQPFGGAIRILDLNIVGQLLGDFHFDDERSRAEQDFRILIRPAAWPLLRDFCLEHMNLENDRVFETDPRRELAEEFAETLEIDLRLDQYVCQPVATIVENEATPTDNIHGKGTPTVRIYRIFEASITDLSLRHVMIEASESLSRDDLVQLAVADARNGGRGTANAILTLPWRRLHEAYQAVAPEARNRPVMFGENQLYETVATVLDEITVPKYLRL